MRKPPKPPLPDGSTWIVRKDGRADAGEALFCFLSGGDRVWGRCRLPRERAATSPGVIFVAPDGCAEGKWAAAALERFGAWATTATIDLSLCGRRRSDKLSPVGLDCRSPVGAMLAPELASQLRRDLSGVMGLLAAQCGVDPERTAIVALGLGASLLAPTLEESPWRRVVLAPPVPCASQPRIRAMALPGEEELERWLDDLAAELRSEGS
jgi:hypothetical protein